MSGSKNIETQTGLVHAMRSNGPLHQVEPVGISECVQPCSCTCHILARLLIGLKGKQ